MNPFIKKFLYVIINRYRYKHNATNRSKGNMALLLTLFGIASTFSGFSYSQWTYSSSDNNGQGETQVELKNDPDFSDINAAFDKYSIMYTSVNDLDKIPPRSLYYIIFRNILDQEAEHRRYFTEQDWSKIELLPAHNDASILVPQFATMKSTCFAFENLNELSLDYSQLLDLYVEAVEEASMFLDNHYVTIYQALSDGAKTHFDHLTETYRGSNRLVFTTFDFKKIGQEIPNETMQIMSSKCDEISDLDITKIKTGETLKKQIFTSKN